MTPRVAIIGGGLAGLTAAHRLLARNIDVTVIDKGRHVGGRMCTRSVELPDGRTARFDLGPPILYARLHHARGLPTYGVTNLATELPGNELFGHREVGRIGAEGEPGGYGPITGLTAAGGMRELAFRLTAAHGDPLHFRDHTLAERLERTDDGWRVHTRSLRDGFEHDRECQRSRSHAARSAGARTAPAQPRHASGRDPRLAPKGGVLALHRDLRRVHRPRPAPVGRRLARRRAVGVDQRQRGEGGVAGCVVDHRAVDRRVGGGALERARCAGVGTAPAAVAGVGRLAGEPRERVGASVAVGEAARARALAVRGAPRPRRGARRRRVRRAAPDPVDAAVASGEAATLRMGVLLTALARADDRYTVARPKRYTLEIAVSTPEEARLAEVYGADRLELSSGLEVGGLTPSFGLFREVRDRAQIPVYVLIRPRPGGFAYTGREFAVMRADAQMFLAEGADGIVFGALTTRRADRHRPLPRSSSNWPTVRPCSTARSTSSPTRGRTGRTHRPRFRARTDERGRIDGRGRYEPARGARPARRLADRGAARREHPPAQRGRPHPRDAVRSGPLVGPSARYRRSAPRGPPAACARGWGGAGGTERGARGCRRLQLDRLADSLS